MHGVNIDCAFFELFVFVFALAFGVIFLQECKIIVNRMKLKAIKYICFTYALFLILSLRVLAAPAVQLVDRATIDLVQGSQIFANGKMQAMVRVQYKLMTGATVTSITLKEFGSEEELKTLGWTVSETDNGFDHNIFSSRANVPYENFDSRFVPSKGKEYLNLYISTEKSNAKINTCFVINAKKGTVTSTFSTCKAYDSDRGTVVLHSLRPPVYDGRDFELEDVKDDFYVKEGNNVSVAGKVHVIRAKAHLSGRAFSIKRVSGAIAKATGAMYDYSTTSLAYKKDSISPIHSRTAHLFYADSFNFTFDTLKSPDVGGKENIFLLGQYGNSLLAIITLDLYLNTFLVLNGAEQYLYRCKVKSTTWVCVDEKGVVKIYPAPEIEFEQKIDMLSVTDNYGTSSTLTLYYNSDDMIQLR